MMKANVSDTTIQDLLAHAEWARALAGRLIADPDRADDVAQEAMAAAALNPPRDDRNVRGWLAQVVRNVASGIGRDEGRRHRRERTAARPEGQPAADELVHKAELSRDLAQHVLALDEIYRTVVLLRWYEGLPPRAIAKKLGVPVATVNTRLARAHAELRGRLDRAYGDRTTWCAAFAPFALFPKCSATVSVAWVAGLLVASTVGFVTWRVSHVDPRTFYQDIYGQGWVVDPRRPLDPPQPWGPDRSNAGTARVPAVAGEPSIPVPSGAGRSALGSVHLAGRVIDFDGRPVAGLDLRGRDPSLARIEAGWLRFGNQGVTITPEELETFRRVPEALAHAIEHHGNPPGMRETLLGIDLSARTMTGADGRFELNVPGRSARIELIGGEFTICAEGRIEGSPEPVLLVAPTVSVAGVVVDSRGDPIEGARLMAEGLTAAIEKMPIPFETPSAFSTYDEVVSDASGAFDLGRIARFPGARILAAIGTRIAADVEVPAFDTRDLRFVAQSRADPRKPHVRGILLDDRGSPVEKAEIRLGGRPALTGADGRFDLEVDGSGSDGDLVAVKRGMAPGAIEGFGSRVRLGGDDVDDVELRLPSGPALSITGRALDNEGVQLTKWVVTLEGTVKYPGYGIPLEFAAAGIYSAKAGPKTDGDGRFEIGGLGPRGYRLKLVDPRTGLVHITDPIEAGSRDVEVRVPADAWRDSIRGRVVSTRGEPAAGVRIAVQYPITESRGSSSWGLAASTKSDSDGGFELERVPRRGLTLGVSGKSLRMETIAVPDDVDPSSVVLTVTVMRKFRLEPREGEAVDEFEMLDSSGNPLSILAFKADAQSSNPQIGRDGAEFPVCEVSEDATTLVLRNGGKGVRRVPVTWTGERLQVLRP